MQAILDAMQEQRDEAKAESMKQEDAVSDETPAIKSRPTPDTYTLCRRDLHHPHSSTSATRSIVICHTLPYLANLLAATLGFASLSGLCKGRRSLSM